MTRPTDEGLAEFDLVIPAKARRESAAQGSRGTTPRRNRRQAAADKRSAKRRRKARVAAECAHIRQPTGTRRWVTEIVHLK